MYLMPQLRQNIITGEWVVIAPERAKRPSDFTVARGMNVERLHDSPFLVGGKAWEHRLKEFDTKNTYTVPNLFPAFVCDEKMCSTRSYYPEKSFYRAKEAIGDHDVVVIKDPEKDVYSFSLETWDDLIKTFQTRNLSHNRNPEIEYVTCIYNHGEQAGASIKHPHAQIFASPIVPNYVQKELDGAERYYNNNGVNVFTDILHHEIETKVRLLAKNKYFTAFTFYAARFPFETWIMPNNEQSQFAAINKTERGSLASIMQKIMSLFKKTLDGPAINFWIHTLPATQQEARYFTWHLEISPRVTGYGGFELGSGVIIDIMSPEKAALYLSKSDNHE